MSKVSDEATANHLRCTSLWVELTKMTFLFDSKLKDLEVAADKDVLISADAVRVVTTKLQRSIEHARNLLSVLQPALGAASLDGPEIH